MAVAILTVLTQVGGLVYLIYLPVGRRIGRHLPNWPGKLLRAGGFLLLLVVTSLWLLPPLARSYGRVALPLRATEQVPLGPGRWFTILANRHYVKPELLAAVTDITRRTAARYPGTELRYLDANFPFLEGFPLYPHRSHDDGEKLDLSFLYTDADGARVTASPGFLGYGHTEGPVAGEFDQPRDCRAKGYWQYDLLRHLAGEESNLQFDATANGWLLRAITADDRIGKVFVEPHLKTRLGLEGEPKIRFHGCGAVRHDDHIHLQL